MAREETLIQTTVWYVQEPKENNGTRIAVKLLLQLYPVDSTSLSRHVRLNAPLPVFAIDCVACPDQHTVRAPHIRWLLRNTAVESNFNRPLRSSPPTPPPSPLSVAIYSKQHCHPSLHELLKRNDDDC